LANAFFFSLTTSIRKKKTNNATSQIKNEVLRNVCCYTQKMNTGIQINYTDNMLFEAS